MTNYNERQLNNGEQGEGSGLNADKVDNSEGSELGNTIDGSSITENQSGEIQADPSIRGTGWEKVAEKQESDGSVTVSVSGYDNYYVAFKREAPLNNGANIEIQINGYNSEYEYYSPNGNLSTGKSSWITHSIQSEGSGAVIVGSLGARENYLDNPQTLFYYQGVFASRTSSGELRKEVNEEVTQITVSESGNADSLKVEVYGR